MWMRIAVISAGAHGLYDAAFSAGSVESKSLWAAVSIGLLAAGADPLRYWPAVLAGLIARWRPGRICVHRGQPSALAYIRGRYLVGPPILHSLHRVLGSSRS